MKRTKQIPKKEQFIERRIITGLIISTEYLQGIRKIWTTKLLADKSAKIMANWCIEFYDEYHAAPGQEIESIFLKKTKNLSKNDREDIEDILASLSDEYEHQEKFNISYLIDQTIQYFDECNLRDFIDDITAEIEDGDIISAKKIAYDYKPAIDMSDSNISEFILTLDQMMNFDIEKPRLLMSPWLREGQVTYIYSQYGTGKSLLAINIAELLALNIEDAAEWDLGEWQVKNPTGCLYVDGEMGLVEFRERLDQFKYLGKQQYEVLGFPLPEYQLATEDDFFLSERKNQLQILSNLSLYHYFKKVWYY